MCCKKCMLTAHTSLPLHLVKEWTGTHWLRKSLKDLGLVIQLGHPSGESCYLPKAPHSDDFVIINGNGIHAVTLRFCGCKFADSHIQQLLRYRLFPASTDKPRTAATFSVMEEFHLLSLESKVSAHHYYSALARRGNNVGLSPPKDRYEQFMHIVREWRHLKMLKRSGRGHHPSGVDMTQEGECAIHCPACPHPGINLPDDWMNVCNDKRWLYALFVAIDANFHLKRRAVSKDAVDPSLSNGWAYFVEELSYKQYLTKHSDTRQEKSLCSSHGAVNDADTKSSVGLAATGTGSICCARHEMKLPRGVGDLQKGERYVNMDYIFFSALKDTTLNRFNVSYDIVCQWSRHLWERMKTLPPSHHFTHVEKQVILFVPKFHLPAHVAECQWKYSFNYIKGAARTDGEAPERGWSTLNAVASSTKEMGPGHRRDTLDDLIGDSNWKKLIGLGESILRKLKEAVPERNEHQEDLLEFERSLEARYGEQLARWRADVEAWEKDMSKPNLFEVKSKSVTQAAVRLQLAQEESDQVESSIHVDISPSVLISTGIDLEEQQRRLRVDAEKHGSHGTEHQKMRLQQRTNSLLRRIETWVSVQMLYMPAVASLRVRGAADPAMAPKPQDLPLLLPSALHRQVPCDGRLEEIEWRLRFGQAHDALEELRQALHSRTYMLRFKDRFLRGQGANTRARNCLRSVDVKVNGAAAKYRAAHNALLELSPLLGKDGWKGTLRRLENNDIRSMTEGTDERSSEGRRRLSWIWIMCGYTEGTSTRTEDDSEDLQDAIRIEWYKTRARTHRWAEEVELLVEEQRRVLKFLHWQSKWWLDRQALMTVDDPALQQGLKAYAIRQATLMEDLAMQFQRMWNDTERYIMLADGHSDGVEMD
ncbi:hypothetical protein L210DRAFT_3397494 [Boletus edulis BED1]|uniref:CxC2-like cysteine cluster KDZ transposase-associated domain-containing protein n=1 Tax=Boletus edulis BED1 TaxID=1328754 RepID=A0AAD4GH50_BOLED|nr:hypothetical protein L210DRAFT_3397494 [Boletus edulis BED1]